SRQCWNDGMGRRIDVKANDILEFVGECGVIRDLEGARPMRLKSLSRPDASHRGPPDPHCLGHRWGPRVGRLIGRRTTRSTVSDGSGGIHDGRVLSRVNPAIPSCMKRSCQRQTTVLSLPTAQVMALVPMPSAVSKAILPS